MPSETDSARHPATAPAAISPDTLVPPHKILAKWICPACTGIGSDQPQSCSRCGRVFVPGVLSNEDASPDRELRLMTWYLRFGLLLGLPLIAMGVIDAFDRGRPVRAAFGDQLFLGIQALL